jgi:hypothetical protein
MSRQDATDPGAEFTRGPGASMRGLVPSLALNAVAPFVLYQILTGNGVATLDALIATSVFPIAGILVGWIRTRRLDGIAILSLVFIALGLVTSLIAGDPRFYLIKESFLTGLFGIVCLVSLALTRPLIFYFARQFAGGGDPARMARFDSLWQYPLFRRSQRLTTAVWGVAYLIEAAARYVLALVLPIPVFLVVSPVMAIGVTIALIYFSIAYGRRVARRGSELRSRRQGAA